MLFPLYNGALSSASQTMVCAMVLRPVCALALGMKPVIRVPAGLGVTEAG